MRHGPEVPDDEIQDLLAGYALGTLEPDELQFIEHYLPQRPLWAAELEHYREVAIALSHAPDLQEVPLRVRAGMLAEVATGESSANQPEPPQPSRWRRRLAVASYAAAVPATIVAIVLVGYTVIMHDRIATKDDQLAQYQQAQGETVEVLAGNELMPIVIEMRESNAAPLARGRLFVNRADNQAVLYARDLPQLDDGEFYTVWLGASSTSTAVMRIGTLTPTEQGSAQITVGPLVDLEHPNQVTITIESDADAAQPAGDIVLSADF